jgi:hypothetical protein
MTKAVLYFPRIKFTTYFPCKQIMDIYGDVSKRRELNVLDAI